MALIAPSVILVLLSFAGIMGLTFSQKGNRKFERKGVMLYLFIILLFFLVAGLMGLLYPTNPFLTILTIQGLGLLFGIFHAWFLFSNYAWSDHASFWPETFLTLAITATAGLGLLNGLNLWDFVFKPHLGYAMILYKGIFWIPFPYLILRTYDFISQIPSRRFVAWRYPDTTPPKINLEDRNVIFVYFDIYAESEDRPAGKITNCRTRMPKDNTSVEILFQNFVKDYNETNKDFPITNLQKDVYNNPIGWLFYSRRTPQGRMRLLNPFLSGVEQIHEGDIILVRRVALGEEFKASSKAGKQAIYPAKNKSDDDDIIIIREK